MNDLLNLQIAKDRQAALLREAQQRSLATVRTPREPLVSVRLTIELHLGSRNRQIPSQS
jgi:hypothetical protein